MRTRILKNAHASIARLCQDFIDEIKAASLADPVFFNFDAHGVEHELPERDLVGMAAFTIEVDDGTHEVTCSIGVAPWNDKNLFRHIDVMDRLYDRLQPLNQVDLYDATSGDRLGWMSLLNGTSMLPMTTAEVRPLQFISFRAAVDPLAAQR